MFNQKPALSFINEYNIDLVNMIFRELILKLYLTFDCQIQTQ